MSTHPRSRWLKVALPVIALTGLLALVSSGALAAEPCKKVKGSFTLQTISGSGCMSPIGLCAMGLYQGDIKGTSFFTGSSLVATADTPSTGVVLVTGDNTITTKDGVLQTKDAIVLRTVGDGDFAENDTIVSGATGYVQGIGTFVGGSGEGEYSGKICRP